MEMRGGVRGIKTEAHDAFKAEARGGKDSKSQGGYVDDYYYEDGYSLEL